jgi:predicted amidohydrolase
MASNRIRKETFDASEITFYGGSFIVGPSGTIMALVRNAIISIVKLSVVINV